VKIWLSPRNSELLLTDFRNSIPPHLTIKPKISFCEGTTFAINNKIISLSVSSMNQKENLSLSGEVVEIYEKDGFKLAKIRYNPGFLEIPINDLRDAHLNDKIIINSSIKIESITHNLEDNFKIIN
jgi:hypothetical protein